MLNNYILFNRRGHGEHGGDLASTQGIRGANRAGQTKNSASKLDRLPCSRPARYARDLLTIKYAACI